MKQSSKFQQDNFLYTMSFSFSYWFPFSTYSMFLPPSPHFKTLQSIIARSMSL